MSGGLFALLDDIAVLAKAAAASVDDVAAAAGRASAKAAGVIVGTDTPIVMCSRADNHETKLCSIALGCLMAGLNK